MSALANILLAEVLKVGLPIVAEQLASFAIEKEPELKAVLAKRLGESSPLVQEIFELLVEPGLVTIGHLLTTIGSAAPTKALPAPASTGPTQPWPDFRDN